MRRRCVLTICAAALLLAGCGALRQGQDDTQPPIGASHEMLQILPTQRYDVLYDFAISHGRGAGLPGGGLLDVDGTLYGTTLLGGENGRCISRVRRSCGILYSLSTSGVYNVVHAFRGGVRDGANPEAGLIDVNGTLYGTTEYGGSGYGTVYSISATGAVKVLHSFAGGSDGANPTQGDLLYVNGTLYGVTYGGGANGSGTVYSITTSGGETVLHSFGSGDDGEMPQWGLINVGGTMFGTTLSGGAHSCGTVVHRGCGTVYSITASGAETVLYSFAGSSDGAAPNGGLIDVKGTLYGTTELGGTNCAGTNPGCGTVYSITTTGKEHVLYSFLGNSDGLNPTGPLIDVKGKLYGTTAGYFVCCARRDVLPARDASGTEGSNGTIFSVTTTGTENVLYNFTGGADGSQPDAPLIDVNGTLYGTTAYGGKGWGTVFALTL